MKGIDHLVLCGRDQAAMRENYAALGFTLTPYVTGQPFRTWALQGLLSQLAQKEAVWSATASEAADAAR